MATVHQPGYYLIRKPGEPFVCEWADSPKEASRKVFGEVLQGKAGEWKYLGDAPYSSLGGAAKDAADFPDGWNRMDNRGAYPRNGEARPERRRTPRPETPPGYEETPASVDDITLILNALQRGMDTVEKWVVKFEKLGMVNMARKVRQMGKEFEEAVMGADVPEAVLT